MSLCDYSAHARKTVLLLSLDSVRLHLPSTGTNAYLLLIDSQLTVVFDTVITYNNLPP